MAVGWEDIVLMGTAMGILGTVQKLREMKQEKAEEKSDIFNQALCNEKHKTIDQKLNRIVLHQDSICEKLDHIKDLIIERK